MDIQIFLIFLLHAAVHSAQYSMPRAELMPVSPEGRTEAGIGGEAIYHVNCSGRRGLIRTTAADFHLSTQYLAQPHVSSSK